MRLQSLSSVLLAGNSIDTWRPGRQSSPRRFVISTSTRRQFVKIAGSLAIAALVVAGHLLPGLDDTAIDLGIRNALHVIVFAMLSGFLFVLFQDYSVVRRVLASLAIVVGIGFVAEFAQLKAGRQFSVVDLARDAVGGGLCIASLLAWQLSEDANGAVRQFLARSSSILFATMILIPIGFWLSVIAMGRSASPSILSFDKAWEAHIYFTVNSEFASVAGDDVGVGGSDNAGDLTLSGMWRSGIGVNTLVRDWRKYQFLTFDAVMVSGPRTRISVRVNDKQRFGLLADEFISRAWVETTPGKISIPLQRVARQDGRPDLDMSDIRQFFVFARNKRAGTVLRLDNFRLE